VSLRDGGAGSVHWGLDSVGAGEKPQWCQLIVHTICMRPQRSSAHTKPLVAPLWHLQTRHQVHCHT